MKVVLVLCLLAFMSCQKDIMDIAKCLYESPKVKEIIADVMVAIATKDFSKLWPKIKDALPELIPTVIKCITENEVNLEARRSPASACTRCKNNLPDDCKTESCIEAFCGEVCSTVEETDDKPRF